MGNKLLVLKRNIEAILFAAGKALELEFIAELCDASVSGTKKQLKKLQKKYSEHPVLMIVDQDSTWKMTVREQYLDVVSKIVSNTELSKSVLETLSIIAYRNPALQSDIVKARGSATYDHVSQLVDLGFVIKERVGRSYMLKLTEKFYEYFEVDGKKIKEVFQPVNERISEQMNLGNFKLGPKEKDEEAKKDIFEKSKEERLGELEIYRVENEKNAKKINNLRDSHKDFLNNVEKEIDDISKRTDADESEIESVKSSDVQNKVNEIKEDTEIVVDEDEDSSDEDIDTDEMLGEAEEVMDDLKKQTEEE